MIFEYEGDDWADVVTLRPDQRTAIMHSTIHLGPDGSLGVIRVEARVTVMQVDPDGAVTLGIDRSMQLVD